MIGYDAMGKNHTLDGSHALDTHLNRLFGPTFAQVLEYETRRELGVTLFEALRDNPSGAISVMLRIFRKGEAVSVIFQNLKTKLSESRTEHDKMIVSLFDQAMPLITAVD